MRSESEFSELVRSWLRTDHDDPAPRVVDDALALLDGTPQRRAVTSPALGSPLRVTLAGIGVAAVAIVAVMAGGLLPADGPPAAATSTTQSVGPTRGPTPSASGRAVIEGHRAQTTVAGARLSFLQPEGWEDFGPENPDYISKDVIGPQGAEAQIVWAAFPSLVTPAECHYLRTWSNEHPLDRSMAALADAVASVPGTDLVAGPAETTVGGFPAIHVMLLVVDDVGCDPGFFFTYPMTWGGALWPETEPGDTVRVWLLETPERWIFIEAKTKPEAGSRLEAEIQAIVDSIVIE